jgi:hypothetical protein
MQDVPITYSTGDNDMIKRLLSTLASLCRIVCRQKSVSQSTGRSWKVSFDRSYRFLTFAGVINFPAMKRFQMISAYHQLKITLTPHMSPAPNRWCSGFTATVDDFDLNIPGLESGVDVRVEEREAYIAVICAIWLRKQEGEEKTDILQKSFFLYRK